MIVVVPALGQLGLGKAHDLVLVVGDHLGRGELGIEVDQLGGGFAGTERLARGVELLGQFDVCGDLRQARILLAGVVHETLVRPLVEFDLVLLPGAARNVVVPNRPNRPSQQQRDHQHEQRTVGLALFGGIQSQSASHLNPVTPYLNRRFPQGPAVEIPAQSVRFHCADQRSANTPSPNTSMPIAASSNSLPMPCSWVSPT